MTPAPPGPLLDRFLAAADAVAAARPEVDRDLAREVFAEAATLLHDGLALDGLDDHDTAVVVSGLCADLVTEDPGAAVRARSRAASQDRGDLHDGTRCRRRTWSPRPCSSSERAGHRPLTSSARSSYGR